MKVIIAGSREITNYEFVSHIIKQSGYTITEVVSGTANGVDRLGEQWARDNNIPYKRFPANWDHYGKAAGPIRNREMAEYADAAIVVWNGSSSGTKNMIQEMTKREKPCKVEILKTITGITK